VKFLLVPLLIIGMFVSFTAALIAMLFFTKTVQTPQELVKYVLGGPDSTQIFEKFRLREDQLDSFFKLAEKYKGRYEEQAALAEAVQDSLATERMQLQALEDSLLTEKQRIGLISDSTMKARQEANIKELAKFYVKVKANLAAEILQQETELSDTTVAMLMKNLPPAHMGKIMGNMNPDFAARITKIMQELSR